MRTERHAEQHWTPLNGNGTGFVLADWRDRFAAAGLLSIGDLLSCTGEALSKPGLRTRYRARLRLHEQCVFLKRFDGDRFADRFRRWREDGEWYSPAERELRVATALHSAQIPATGVLAWGRQSSGGRERSFVVLSAAPGEPADGFLQRRRGAPQLRKLARPLAEMSRNFHRQGWRHRDFYLCHIFVREAESCGVELTLIDLQRVFRPRHWADRWRVKDLAQLAYSAQELVPPRVQLRFYRDYAAGQTRSTKRRWLNAIRARVKAMNRRANKFEGS